MLEPCLFQPCFHVAGKNKTGHWPAEGQPQRRGTNKWLLITFESLSSDIKVTYKCLFIDFMVGSLFTVSLFGQ